jgi:hypothetical protein
MEQQALSRLEGLVEQLQVQLHVAQNQPHSQSNEELFLIGLLP